MAGTSEEANIGDGGFQGFERILPENCVEYMLLIIESDPQPKKVLSSLEAVRKAANQLSSRLTKDYIWQRDGFSLEIKTEKGMSLSDRPRGVMQTFQSLTWANRSTLSPRNHRLR